MRRVCRERSVIFSSESRIRASGIGGCVVATGDDPPNERRIGHARR